MVINVVPKLDKRHSKIKCIQLNKKSNFRSEFQISLNSGAIILNTRIAILIEDSDPKFDF